MYIKRKMISALMACVFVILLTYSVAAETLIQPRWSNVSDVVLAITYNSNKATCELSITGFAGTTKITNCDVYLKDSSGTTIDSWTGLSATGTTFNLRKTATGVSSDNSYTLSFTATVHRNGSSEKINGSTTKKYN